MSKEAVLRKSSTVAYTRAYLRSPNWSTVFSPDVSKLIQLEASKLRSSESNVSVSFLMATAAVIGKHGFIKIPDGKDVFLNMYIMLVGRPGCGKTAAINRFLLEPVKKIEDQEKVKTVFQDCTSAGLLKLLQNSEGVATLAADECCPRLATMLSSRRDDNCSMRANFNIFFSGFGTDKVFATQGTVSFTNVFFSIIGTAQPHPFMLFLKELRSVEDGLLDRFYCVASRPNRCEAPADFNPPIVDTWVYDALKRIRQLHATDSHYELAPEATELFQEMRRSTEEEMANAYEELEGQVHVGDILGKELPTDNNDSKAFDYAVKLAALIHISEATLSSVLGGNVRQLQIPPVIQKPQMEAALHLLSSMQMQRNEFLSFLRDNIQYEHQREAQQILDKKKYEDIRRMILLFPGRAVTTNMIVRKNSSLRSRTLEVRATMINLSNDKGTPKFVGKYKRVGRNKDVFYKADWPSCDREFMDQLEITQEDYEEEYNADMSNPPCSQMPHNWREYYDDLLDHIPDMNAVVAPDAAGDANAAQ